MNIRLEQPQDWREVENLTREAFWNVYRPGCLEHYVLNQYRKSPDFIPELDFVMEEEGKIIGHIMFSKAELTLDDGSRKPSWTFGPISIHPDYKRKGYGLKLLNYALDKARERGIGFLCMEGNIDSFAWKATSTSTSTQASASPANSRSIITTSHAMPKCLTSLPKSSSQAGFGRKESPKPPIARQKAISWRTNIRKHLRHTMPPSRKKRNSACPDS